MIYAHFHRWSNKPTDFFSFTGPCEYEWVTFGPFDSVAFRDGLVIGHLLKDWTYLSDLECETFPDYDDLWDSDWGGSRPTVTKHSFDYPIAAKGMDGFVLTTSPEHPEFEPI